MNSTGGYVYVLYGEDSFGRDEAVQVFLERFPSPMSRACVEISKEANRQNVSQRDSLRALAAVPQSAVTART